MAQFKKKQLECPNLAKFYQLAKNEGLFRNLEITFAKTYAIGQILFAKNGQILNKPSAYMVTLVTIEHFPATSTQKCFLNGTSSLAPGGLF